MEILPRNHSLPSAGIDPKTEPSSSVQITPPQGGGSLDINPNADLYQQATEAFEQLGYDAPEPPPFNDSAVSDDIDVIEKQKRELERIIKGSEDRYSQVRASIRSKRSLVPVEDGRPHIEKISGIIENIHNGYQKEYGEIIKATTEYMQNVNAALGSIVEYMKPGSGGKIVFQRVELMCKLDDLFKNYTDHSSVRKPKPLTEQSDALNEKYYKDWSNTDNAAEPIYSMKYTEAAFKFWEKKLDGQGFNVKARGYAPNTVIKIYPDIKPLKEIMSIVYNMPVGWARNGDDVLAQNIQSMQTAIDSQKNAVNNSVSRLLETFRQDNSHFDTLTQLLVQLIKDLNQYNNGIVNL